MTPAHLAERDGYFCINDRIPAFAGMTDFGDSLLPESHCEPFASFIRDAFRMDPIYIPEAS